jgi:hypothetical protein
MALATTAVLWTSGCGGATSTLRAQGPATGSGPAHLVLRNGADVALFELHVAKTQAVSTATAAGAAPGSEADIDLWGEDYLGRSRVQPGASFTIGDLPADRYDVLAVDPDGREQLVKGLKLKAGGKYVLELGDRWQQTR